MEHLIGREKEIKALKRYANSRKSEFIAIYGRRRVGKTYLVREVFKGQFAFQTTGLDNVGMKDQLSQFHAGLVKYSNKTVEFKPAKNWFQAFNQLIELLEQQSKTEKKVIFLDELPWLDSPRSKFLSGLEYFWNSWASARRDILLIVCGSAASWMIKNLLNNKGGLHNRITGRIRLEPFNLAETKAFLQYNETTFDSYSTVLLYMVFGGIPFYLDMIQEGRSADQNINALCFERNAPLRDEFKNLYASLFNRSERHVSVIKALAEKRKGLTRIEIATNSGISNGGGLTRILEELEESSFIRKYQSLGNKQKNPLYQLIDLYSLFFLNFIQDSSKDDEYFWINSIDSSSYRNWSGYAFEMVCLHHVQQIKTALGISGVQTKVASWHNKQAQIDLVIDRKDQVINLCEMKFSIHPYTIDKKYADNLRNKIGQFKSSTNTPKSIFLTLVTTHGLVKNKHSYLVQNDISMEDLFRS